VYEPVFGVKKANTALGHKFVPFVFSGRIYPLKNQPQRIAVGGVVKLLRRAQLLDVFFQKFLILFLRFVKRLHDHWPLPEVNSSPGRTWKSLEWIFIFLPSEPRTALVALNTPGF
jgi:hypothetical protein